MIISSLRITKVLKIARRAIAELRRCEAPTERSRNWPRLADASRRRSGAGEYGRWECGAWREEVGGHIVLFVFFRGCICNLEKLKLEKVNRIVAVQGSVARVSDQGDIVG
jgi:hypothetical protein